MAVAIAVSSLVGARDQRPPSALAASPPGTYAVAIRASESMDTVVAIPLDDPSQALQVASISHLPGFTTTGSVSPDGKTAALIVVDGGSFSRPTATLVFLDLGTGAFKPVKVGLDARQIPPWAPDSLSVAVSHTELGEDGRSSVTVESAATDGLVELVGQFPGAAAVFPFAVDAEGAVISTVLAADGSSLYSDTSRVQHLGPFITRDWSLSPDGGAVAYIEVNTDAGVRYVAKTATFGAQVQAASLTLSGPESLGTAWRPGSLSPTFGLDPGSALTAGTTGFDVPLDFSPSGSALAVAHWSGTSYEQPGSIRFEAVTASGRISLEPATRFLGWAER